MQEHILELAKKRGSDTSFCPSEVARTIRDSNWRNLIPTVWDAVEVLHDEGRLQVEQSGEPVDPGAVSSPARLRGIGASGDNS